LHFYFAVNVKSGFRGSLYAALPQYKYGLESPLEQSESCKEGYFTPRDGEETIPSRLLFLKIKPIPNVF